MADEATSTTKHKPAPVPGADNYRVLKNTCASYLDADALAKIEEVIILSGLIHQKQISGKTF